MQHHSNSAAPARVCPDCDGQATAAISIGPRTPAGTLPTLTVACRACHGTGRVPARPAPVPATARR